MAEKVPITCPECAKQFEAPPDIVGRKIRCKNCGKIFVAKKAENVKPKVKKADEKLAEEQKANKATIPVQDDDDDDGDGKPYEVTSVDLAPRCPECANELESEDDLVCLHCGFNLKTRTRAETRRVRDVTGGKMFLWLLPGILSAIGFFVCVGLMVGMIINWIFWFRDPETAKQEQYAINCVHCCALWWCIGCIYLGYKSFRFSLKRLIFQNTPPEEEV
jgi:DNA-directed RNA polymerase subunit RPC12/RpoP